MACSRGRLPHTRQSRSLFRKAPPTAIVLLSRKDFQGLLKFTVVVLYLGGCGFDTIGQFSKSPQGGMLSLSSVSALYFPIMHRLPVSFAKGHAGIQPHAPPRLLPYWAFSCHESIFC